MTTTSIEWTDKTWNPVRGCSVISPGCTNCYAMKQGHRFNAPGRAYEGLTKLTKAGPQWSGIVRTVEDALDQPLRWKEPARIFVNSMSDLFHEDVSSDFIMRVFEVMEKAHRHTFQILTKRADRMVDILGGSSGAGLSAPPLPNVWLGVSVENQQYADERIPLLLQTPAAVRFISAEPLLGNLDLFAYVTGHHGFGLDWVIVGGESGPKARPFDIAWGQSIVRQCKAADVPVFVKQLGRDPRGWCSWPHHHECPPKYLDDDGTLISITGRPGTLCHAIDDSWWPCSPHLKSKKGGDPNEWPEDLRVRQFPSAQ